MAGTRDLQAKHLKQIFRFAKGWDGTWEVKDWDGEGKDRRGEIRQHDITVHYNEEHNALIE